MKDRHELSVYEVLGKGVVTIGNDKQIIQVKETVDKAISWAVDNAMLFPIYLECF